MSDTGDAKRERRRAVRHKCKVRIEMIVRFSYGMSGDWSENAVEIKGRLLDLSTEGAMLYTKEPFEPGQELRLTILIPKELAIVTGAVVRWCEPVPEKDDLASGVKFRNLPAEGLAAIAKFLRELEKISAS